LPEKLTRRDFSERLAFGSFWAAMGASVLGMFKLLKPAVMPEASTKVNLGHPEELPPGTQRYFAEQKLFVFSDGDSVYAISAICPHLGCIVQQLPENRFECPCHGSRFNASGEVFAGPAPSGLPWIQIRRAPNGALYADTAVTVPSGTRWNRT
jgi:cytochrome b6-f complex iron-sulfur subunit